MIMYKNLPTLQHFHSDAAKPGVSFTSAASYDKRKWIENIKEER